MKNLIPASTLRITALAAALLAGTAAANAQVLYSTNFNAPAYSNGGLIGQDGWLITGTSVINPITVTAGTVALASTGQDVNRPFLPAVTTGSIFLSADITLSAANTAGDYFMHLSDGGNSNFFARLYARSATGGFQLALTTSSGAATSYGTTVLSFGTTYTILARYDFVAGAANDTGALFVNPTTAFGLGDTAYVAAQTTGADAASISAVNLRQGAAANAPTAVVDNISVSIIPTPATASLLAVGGLLAARRRRN